MSDEIEKDLKNTKGDYLHTIVKSGISSVPLVGSALGEFFSTIVSQPISKRRDDWLIKIKNELDNLSEKVNGFDINNLCNNEMFVTALMNASQIAIRNHHEIKLEALKNAVLNSAMNIDIDDSVQLMYINYIDELTPWHLKILEFFKNPTEWFEKHNKNIPDVYTGSPSDILEDAYEELGGRQEFYNLVARELYQKGLFTIERLSGTMMTSSGVFASRTTEFGKNLIRYITAPI
ncbi:hypothetical protein [Clostridium sp. 001]|uniref:hypothetical protein n=1 Tax=Clostridium sp. 001 TaxID=1970093 RepID=UPI001C2CA03E|nr:hypothetical protein [Clostridium sp. 001]QXE20017.1 hypothetical protein B5S50_14955 [Clostridium sp. 001]